MSVNVNEKPLLLDYNICTLLCKLYKITQCNFCIVSQTRQCYLKRHFHYGCASLRCAAIVSDSPR